MNKCCCRNNSIRQFGFMIFTDVNAFINDTFTQVEHITIVHKTDKYLVMLIRRFETKYLNFCNHRYIRHSIHNAIHKLHTGSRKLFAEIVNNDVGIN